VTTDIKGRLSGIGKQWKEKLTANLTAEEAVEASPAENAVREAQEAAAMEGQDAAVEAGVTKPAPEKAETRGDEIPGSGSSGGEPDGGSENEPEKELPESKEYRKISDEELAGILLAFGWHVPKEEQYGRKRTPGATLASPAIEDLAAEVTAAMEEFIGGSVSVYQEEAAPEKPEEGEPAPLAWPVAQETHVFPAVGSENAESRDEEGPAEGTQAEQTPEEVPEPDTENAAEEQQIDAKTLFSGMNQEILKEVFSEEELLALEGDDTHVFKKEELDDLSEKQKEAEENKPIQEERPRQEERPKREVPDRRRTRRPVSRPEKPVRKRAAEMPAEPVFTARDYRPIRRKRSYRTGLRGGLMYFGFVICVSVILASLGWLAADDVLSLNKDYVEAEVYVGEKLDMKQVSAELYNKGLIKYPRLFRIFAKLMKAETKMDPGVYTLSTKLDYNAMVHAMHQSEAGPVERATVMVMIPEGKTLKQTFQILSDHGVCPYETLLECAANHDFKYDFLEDIPLGEETRLEGYLFPDTYQFYASSSPEEAIDKFLSNFNSKVNAELRLQAAEMGYSLHEIVTIASLVEMEAGKDAERPTIASVIYNRLNSSYYPYLQIDATIQYALEERKESLTNEDLEIDSPYNTYKYTGLPPGPIANPGLASIRAALGPEETGYYFYALNKNGSHNFFATLDQFNYFVNSSEFGG
jgi:UPF0755 protein